LLNNNANVNVRERRRGKMPLHYAVMHGHADCARILIEHKADINALSFEKQTPLHDAVIAGSEDCVKLLIDNNAIIFVKDCTD